MSPLVTLGIREATPDDRADWTAFVASRPEGDVLQAWAWGEAGAGERGEHWGRLMVVDAAGRTRGVAQVLDRPRRCSAAPSSTCPTARSGTARRPTPPRSWRASSSGCAPTPAERRGVVLKLDPRASDDADRHGVGGTRARGRRRAPASHDLQATHDADRRPGERDDDPVARWSKDARAEARRAEREGTVARVDRDADPAALDPFHALLAATAERAGFRVRSRAFLGALARPLAASGDWFLALAEHDGRSLAGQRRPEPATAPSTSTQPPRATRSWSRSAGPYAAMAALQRSLRDAGTRTLDLWGVRERDDPSSDPAWEGFSLFKRRFGGAPLRHPGTFDLVIDPRWNRLRDLRERLRDPRP